MSKFRFYDPQLAASMPSLPFSLYQPTTQEENVRRRYESLLRADRGTSPLRTELYDFLYGTGPTDEQLQYNPNDPQTSLLALRSMAQSGGALDAVDAAARERNTAGSAYTSAAADTERINQPFKRNTGLEVDFDALQNISGTQGIGEQLSQAADAFSTGGTFDPNRLPAFSPTAFMQSAPLDIVGERKTRSNNSDIVEQDDTMNTIDTPISFEETVVSAPRIQEAKPQSTVEQVQGTAQEDPTTEEAQSRIRSILSMLGDNPELLSALGILGQGVGGYMQSRAQDKANRRANQEQRVNNAIAAFLDRPAEVAQADTATSKGGNILGALGAALGGYGQARMTQRAMDAESDEMRLDRESAERIARIKAGAAGSGDADGRAGDIANALASFDAYTSALDRAVDEGLGGEPYADFVLDIPILKRMFPEAQAAQPMFEAAALNIATAIQGSRPSEGDRIAFAMLMPQLSDSAAARQAKIRNIRELLNAAQGGQKFQEGWAQNMQGNTSQGGTDPLGLSGATAGDPLGLGG